MRMGLMKGSMHHHGGELLLRIYLLVHRMKHVPGPGPAMAYSSSAITPATLLQSVGDTDRAGIPELERAVQGSDRRVRLVFFCELNECRASHQKDLLHQPELPKEFLEVR